MRQRTESEYAMAIRAQMVKSLRDRTGAGMMDCKNALRRVGGDEEKAVELIQKKGLAKAAKKAGAIAAEGVDPRVHPRGRPHRRAGRGQLPDRLRRAQPRVPGVRERRRPADRLDERPSSCVATDIPADDIEKQKEMFPAQMDEEEAQSGKKRPAEVEGKDRRRQDRQVAVGNLPGRAAAVISEAGKTIAQLAEDAHGQDRREDRRASFRALRAR